MLGFHPNRKSDEEVGSRKAEGKEEVRSFNLQSSIIKGMDFIGWSGVVQFGLQTGATPDGRHSGELLADCAGPAQGRNILGLTPILASVLKLPHRHVYGPMALSLRFPKQVVRGIENRKMLQAMIVTYFRQGGQQLQISIASTEDMKQAQGTPEAYRSLMVRVGGFSAYFTQLGSRTI